MGQASSGRKKVMQSSRRPNSNNLEKLKAYEARSAQFRSLGYDRVLAARWVVEQAGGIVGPVLDVGTGKGALAIELVRAGMDVVSVDVDHEEQALAALLAAKAGVQDRIRLIHGDAERLPYPDGFFGCAAMMDVLHHLPRPIPVLHEMARVVMKGGRIVIADFDERGFQIIARVHREEGREHPRFQTSVDMAKEELVSHGFRFLTRIAECFHDDAALAKHE